MQSNQKTSLILTVYNEEKSIANLLNSIAQQTKLPDEIVIVDAESKDQTFKIANNFAKNQPDLPIKVLKKAGNRSVGRNTAIRNSSFDIIAATDAGCILDDHWLENITKPFEAGNIDVTAGWYQPKIHTQWQKSLSIVMDFNVTHVNANTFLPSTRSMAFTKAAWRLVGGFNESLSHNEDTPFSLKLKKKKAKFLFAPKAIVFWELPASYKTLFSIISRYAFGDAQARLFRSQYWIALGFWCSLIISLILLYNITWIGIVLVLIIINYLYLPLYRDIKNFSLYNLVAIPVIKFTLLAANTIGFIKGLLNKQ